MDIANHTSISHVIATDNHRILGKRTAILFLLGFIGVLSLLPFVTSVLNSTNEALPLPMLVLQFLSVLQATVLLSIMLVLGAWLAPKVNLGTPLIDALLAKTEGVQDIGQANSQQSTNSVLLSSLKYGVFGGVLAGLALVLFSFSVAKYLPADFLINAQSLSLPVATRLLYGGITEEILLRWGTMSLLVWLAFYVFQRAQGTVKAYPYIFGIVVSSLLFALGHLPAVGAMTTSINAPLLAYIMVGNSLFGLIAGYLFWKKGLECAVIAHIFAHLVMLALA